MTKTAIIGAGAIAYCHAEALTRLGVGIAGVMDVNQGSAQKLAARYNAAVIDDLSSVVEHLDMVHICTPPSFRLEYAEPAMAAGCHVVMEKPMAISVADAQALVDLAARHGVQLMIDFNHRFRAGFQYLLDIVNSGVIGDVISVHVQRMGMLGGNAGTKNDTWRRKPDTYCGMSIESLSHDIDMIVQLAGPIATVKADVRGTLADVPQFDTNANVLFNLKNGAVGLICASWSSHLKSSSRGVIGTKGSVALEGDDLFDFARLRMRTDDQPHEQVIRLDDHYDLATCPSYFNANQHFLECMEQGSESSASGRYALQTLKVSHAILTAADTQSAVNL
jgi:predicted dehydrogenase